MTLSAGADCAYDRPPGLTTVATLPVCLSVCLLEIRPVILSCSGVIRRFILAQRATTPVTVRK